jgi:hypothetical protein
MAEPPELWAFLLVNSVLLVAGSVLTALSYRAYRRMGEPTLRLASIGFALVTIGGLLDLGYQFGYRQDYHLGGRELLSLQTVESLTIAAGLVVIFYALTRY